jgi:TonB family protein
MKCSLLVAAVVANFCLGVWGQAVSSPGDSKPANAVDLAVDHGQDPSGFELLDKPKVEKFGAYAGKVLSAVRQRWYPEIDRLRESAYEKRGIAIVEFIIKKDGTLGKVSVSERSGDERLDNTALDAVRKAAPFKPLPTEFKLKSLGFRFHLGYNQPISSEPCPVLQPGVYRVQAGIKAPRVLYGPDPEYSEEARRDKYQGTAVLGLTVGADGLAHDVCVLQALGKGLDEKSLAAVKEWKFEPAIKDGSAVPVRLSVETSFHLF